MTLVYICLMQNPQSKERSKQDGRRLRSVTSQNIICHDDSYPEGILEPTAQQLTKLE